MTTQKTLEHDVGRRLQRLPVDLLSAIARGDVDACQLATQILASRGLNAIGRPLVHNRATRQAGIPRP